MKKDNIEELIYEETNKRLAIMSSKEYNYPPKVTNIDFIIIISLLVVSVIFIVMCMTGVIV